VTIGERAVPSDIRNSVRDIAMKLDVMSCGRGLTPEALKLLPHQEFNDDLELPLAMKA
jgi:hypothetical protein